MHELRRYANPAASLRTASFWVAVLLPAIYLPLLLGGLESTGDATAFLGLIGLHALALSVGHGHDP